MGSIKDQITSYFVGGGLQLKNPELAIANSELYRLKTVSMGKVHLRLNVVLRNFEKYGVEFWKIVYCCILKSFFSQSKVLDKVPHDQY